MTARIEGARATLDHAAFLAVNLREADRLEVLAEGNDPARVLRLLVLTSEVARTLLIDGEIAAMFGVCPQGNGVAMPWALTSNAVDHFPKAFWQASKYALKAILRRYQNLGQCVDARHEKSIRWMKRLGFHVEEQPHECGPLRMPFHRATLQAEG